MATFKILHQVTNGKIPNWHLCFQFGTYNYDDGTSEDGFRFIWRRPDGTLQAARGQARIPSKEELVELLDMASKAGWY